MTKQMKTILNEKEVLEISDKEMFTQFSNKNCKTKNLSYEISPKLWKLKFTKNIFFFDLGFSFTNTHES